MLVITRNIGESFRIRDDVEVLVANTVGESVKLGIDASKYIAVYREEIYKTLNANSGFNDVSI